MLMEEKSLIELVKELQSLPDKKLGQGSFGTVYDLGHNEVLKFIRRPDKMEAQEFICKIEREIDFATKAYALNVGPHIMGYALSEEVCVFKMEKLLPVLEVTSEYLTTIFRYLDILKEHGILHVDTKMDNVMINAKGEYVLIDYGMAVRANYPIAEWHQNIWFIYDSLSDIIEKQEDINDSDDEKELDLDPKIRSVLLKQIDSLWKYFQTTDLRSDVLERIPMVRNLISRGGLSEIVHDLHYQSEYDEDVAGLSIIRRDLKLVTFIDEYEYDCKHGIIDLEYAKGEIEKKIKTLGLGRRHSSYYEYFDKLKSLLKKYIK